MIFSTNKRERREKKTKQMRGECRKAFKPTKTKGIKFGRQQKGGESLIKLDDGDHKNHSLTG